MEPGLVAALVALGIQLPIVALLIVALRKGWLYIGTTVDYERKQHELEMAFREKMRVEAEERLTKYSGLMQDATDVMASTLTFVEKLFAGSTRGSEGPGTALPGDGRRRQGHGSGLRSDQDSPKAPRRSRTELQRPPGRQSE